MTENPQNGHKNDSKLISSILLSTQTHNGLNQLLGIRKIVGSLKSLIWAMLMVYSATIVYGYQGHLKEESKQCLMLKPVVLYC